MCSPNSIGVVMRKSVKPIKVVLAKIGLDGHDRGIRVITQALKDSGMEVVYLGMRQTPEVVVNTAIQEDADVIGISVLSGAHMSIFPKVASLLKDRGARDILLIGGGIIPEDDEKVLIKAGVSKLWGPGASTQEIVEYIQREVATQT